MKLPSTIVPRFGRDYKSKAEVLEAFINNKDFTVADISNQWDGAPCNFSDLKQCDPGTVKIRYKKLANFVMVEMPSGKAK